MPCPCCFDLLLLLVSVLFARFAGRRDQKQCAGRAAKNACANERGREERSSVISSAGNRNYRTEGATCKAGDIPLFIQTDGSLRAFSCPTEQGGLQLVGIKFLGPDRNSEPETCVLFVLGVIKPRAVPGRERDTHRGGSVAAVWYI